MNATNVIRPMAARALWSVYFEKLCHGVEGLTRKTTQKGTQIGGWWKTTASDSEIAY